MVPGTAAGPGGFVVLGPAFGWPRAIGYAVGAFPTTAPLPFVMPGRHYAGVVLRELAPDLRRTAGSGIVEMPDLVGRLVAGAILLHLGNGTASADAQAKSQEFCAGPFGEQTYAAAALDSPGLGCNCIGVPATLTPRPAHDVGGGVPPSPPPSQG